MATPLHLFGNYLIILLFQNVQSRADKKWSSLVDLPRSNGVRGTTWTWILRWVSVAACAARSVWCVDVCVCTNFACVCVRVHVYTSTGCTRVNFVPVSMLVNVATVIIINWIRSYEQWLSLVLPSELFTESQWLTYYFFVCSLMHSLTVPYLHGYSDETNIWHCSEREAEAGLGANCQGDIRSVLFSLFLNFIFFKSLLCVLNDQCSEC